MKNIYLSNCYLTTQSTIGCVARHIHERQKRLKLEVVWVWVGFEVEGGGVRHRVTID